MFCFGVPIPGSPFKQLIVLPAEGPVVQSFEQS
jgi:hypothetical protein